MTILKKKEKNEINKVLDSVSVTFQKKNESLDARKEKLVRKGSHVNCTKNVAR